MQSLSLHETFYNSLAYPKQSNIRMKISYQWLKQFLKIEETPEQLAEILTDLGLEVEVVEQFESIKGGLVGVVVGEVLTCEKHPNADKLKITTVNIGSQVVPIVCGAANVAKGQKVPVATIGTTLYPSAGDAFKINKGKIRGEESHGMICAEDELGIGNDHSGIMVLDAKWQAGTPMSEVLQVYTDQVFEIGLTPNRADAMSHFGVARDLRAGLMQQQKKNLELMSPSVAEYRLDKRILKIDVDVERTDLAPRYCGVTISNIEVKPSPEWLQNRLKAIGLSPINNIVDATNYVLHELGQPLHAFDASKIHGKIRVKTLASGTKFVSLDGVERILHEDDLMICDDKNPLCMAGVYGGLDSGVSEKTTAIFLESAYFNPVSIRKTAKRHGLNTDASFRFERGIDPSITEYALKRACLLIKEIAGGEITSDIMEVYPKKLEDFTLLLNLEKANQLIGEEIPKEEIKKILVSLDIKINSVSDSSLGLVIPSYRVDVQREVDVIEEILRVYGYNKIGFSKKLHATMFNSPKTEDYKIQNLVGNQLNSLGFHEMMNNSLRDEVETAISSQVEDSEFVRILNPLSQDLSVMRQTLLASALEVVHHNINRKNSDLKLFEFGKSYHKKLAGYEEHKHLSLVMTGAKGIENWNQANQEVSFFDLKGTIDQILQRLGITITSVEPATSDVFAEGITYMIGQDALVQFGLLKKSVLKKLDLKQTVLYADFAWGTLLKKINTQIKFQEIPKFPSVKRDLALLVSNTTQYQQLHQLAFATEKKLLKQVALFDVYEGKNLPEGKKSYALSFQLQDEEKTLTDEQIEKSMEKILKAYERELSVTLR